MAATTTEVPATRPGLFARLREGLARRSRRARVHAELSALSDRELADLGIHRVQIDEIARTA
ncbi:MAG: DUF1127 domain-containing protein [Hasllibacter sp.]